MPIIKAAQSPHLSPFSLKDVEAQAKALLLRARQHAEKLLAAAQVEADALKQQAGAKGLAEGRRDGFARGIDEGRKSGHDQALSEHRAAFTAATAALLKGAQEFDTSRRDLESQGLREVIELAAAIARRVTKRQGLLDPDVLAANLEGAMKLAIKAHDVRVAVHPRQLQTLNDALPALQLTWPQLKHVELTEDASLTPGGCRLFSGQGMVDADLDVQLDRVMNELLPVDDVQA